MIVDTHIHLDNEKYYDDIEEVIARAVEEGVERFIIPGADPKDLPRAKALAQINIRMSIMLWVCILMI